MTTHQQPTKPTYTVDDLADALFNQTSATYRQAVGEDRVRFQTKRTAQRLMHAIGDQAQLSPATFRILVWLGNWDEPTIAGVEELLDAAWRHGLWSGLWSSR